MSPPILLWGYPWFLCIEDNACFCCGGRHTLVEFSMRLLHVQCMAKFFELWLFWVKYLTCNVCSRMILYTLHIISMHVHFNKHAQNLFVHILDLITPNSALLPYTNHGPSVYTLVLPACAPTRALIWHVMLTTCIIVSEEHYA